MTMPACPSERELRAFCNDPASFPHVKEHVADCEKCEARMEGWDQLTEEAERLSEFATRAGFTDPGSDIELTSLGRSTHGPLENRLPADDWRSGPVRTERFTIIEFHAEGNLGRVSRAKDWELKREVALKQIKESNADDPDSQARFVVEAEITGALEHPGIVPVYALGTHSDGRPYYAMRFIHGDSLQQEIEKFYKDQVRNWSEVTLERGYQANRPPLDVDPDVYLSREFRSLLSRFVTVCNAIAYGHGRGVLHRDLKPANIMIGKYGETLVVDWGLAKVVGTAEPGSQPPLQPRPELQVASWPRPPLGTPAYMSPEQTGCLDEKYSPQTDVYLLGATLYHLLTARPPHTAKSLARLYRKVIIGDFPAPTKLAPACPPPLEAICLKAMELLPEDRYGSPLELAADVERYLADEQISAQNESLVLRTRRWIRKRPAFATSLITALLIGLIALTVSLLYAAKEKRRFHRRSEFITDIFTLTAKIADQPQAVLEKEESLRKELLRELDQAKERVREEMIDNERLNIRLLAELARGYQRLNVQAKAESLLVESGLKEMHVRTKEFAAGKLQPELMEPMNLPDAVAVAPPPPDQPALGVDSTIRIADELLARTRAEFGEKDPWTILAMIQLGTAYRDLHDQDRSRALYRDALEIQETLGATKDDFYVKYGPLNLRTQLAIAHIGLADFEAAEPLVAEIRAYNNNYTLGGMLMRRTGYAREAMRKISTAYVKAERPDLAADVLKDALKESDRIFGSNDPGTVSLRNELTEVEKPN